MSKKLLMGTIIIGIVIIVAVAFYISNPNILNRDKTNTLQNATNDRNSETDQNTANNEMENIEAVEPDITNTDNTTNPATSSNKKTLVVYYSAQTHKKAVAEKIAGNLNADIFEIVPEQVYTSEDLDWTNNNSRVSKEHDNEALRNVRLEKEKVDNWENYDTVLIGYPIWWGIAAWPVDTFVKANNFSGKTVIPFCTSASSGLGQSGKLLEQEANTGNWLEGHRFSSNPSDSDIKTWTDSLQ